MDQFDNLEAVGSLVHPQAQILNNHLVISFLDESFRFFNFARDIDLEAVVGEILSHRKTDRLFVVDDEQLCRASFCSISNCTRLFPAEEKFPKAAGYTFKCQH